MPKTKLRNVTTTKRGVPPPTLKIVTTLNKASKCASRGQLQPFYQQMHGCSSECKLESNEHCFYVFSHIEFIHFVTVLGDNFCSLFGFD